MITKDTRVAAKELDTPEKHAMAVQAFVNAGFSKYPAFGNYIPERDGTYSSLGIYEGVVIYYDSYSDSEERPNTTLEELLSAENSGFNRTESVYKTKQPEWYDYSKQEALTFPPSGIWCEVTLNNEWWKVFIIGQDSQDYCVFEYDEDITHKFDEPYNGHIVLRCFRPLDWDKLSEENLEKAKQRKELIDIIAAAPSCGVMLADIILNAGFKRNEI